MKPTREEIMAIAGDIHLNNYNTNLLWNEDANIGDIKDFLERFAIAMYHKGQEDMRERAASIVANAAPGFCGGRAEIVMYSCAETIRSLSIEGEE